VPRGAEVAVVSHRDSWTRIRLASGSAGWVPSSAVERVVAP
jgi:SH3-like domain-containing protein